MLPHPAAHPHYPIIGKYPPKPTPYKTMNSEMIIKQ